MSDGSGSEDDLQGVQQDIDELDLLDYSSQSQTSDYVDSDQLLQHPSHSQQMREDELDQQDLLIQQQIAEEEEEERRKAMEDEQKVVSKHQRRPAVISARPPGLKVFQPELGAAFTFSDLSLQKHFGWRAETHTQTSLEEPEDELVLVRYLVPEVPHNLKITSSEDFHSLVNFIFSKAVVCRDRQVYQVLRKCLSDLLSSYAHPWVPSLDLFLTHLLNLGADPLLLNNPQFYSESQDLCQQPSVLPELSHRGQTRDLPGPERQLYTRQLLQITTDVLALPRRQEEYEAVDPKVWKTFIFLTSVVAQERTLINQAETSHTISLLLSRLLSQLSEEESFQDLAQLLSTEFRPAKMSESSTSCWSPEECPEHWRELGQNHPHNMLHLTSLLPAHFSQLQQLLSFMFIQLILNNEDCDLPSECHVEDLIALLENNGGELKKFWAKLDEEEQLYSCWCLLQLLEILVLRVSEMERKSVGILIPNLYFVCRTPVRTCSDPSERRH